MKILFGTEEKLQLCRLIAVISLQQETKDDHEFWRGLAQKFGPKYREVYLRRHEAETVLSIVKSAIDKIALRLQSGDEIAQMRAMTLDAYFQSAFSTLKEKLIQWKEETDGIDERRTTGSEVDDAETRLKGAGCLGAAADAGADGKDDHRTSKGVDSGSGSWNENDVSHR